MCAHLTLIWAKFTLIICLTTTSTALIRNENEKQNSLIESYADPTANPCTDFFQYACGNWKAVHANGNYTDTLERMDYEINQEYESILETRKQRPNEQHRFVRKVLAYYKSCKSVNKYVPMKYLRKLEGYEGLRWPNIERVNKNGHAGSHFWARLRKQRAEADSSDANAYWLKMLATLRKYGMNGVFLTENALPKRNDSGQYIIEFDRPLLNDEFEELRRSTFDMLMEEVGVKDAHRVAPLWQTLHNFETKLLELYEIEDTIGYEEVTLSELTISQLKPYLEVLLNTTHLDVTVQVGVANRAYMHALFNLLSNYDDEFICRYLTMRFLWHLHFDGPADFSNRACINNLRDELPLAMSWLHEQQHSELLLETDNMRRMFESLGAHFAKTLTANPNNFDEEVLEFLTTKLKHMQLKVGNLPRNATVATMEFFHRELALSENDFYGNHLKILRFLARRHHALLERTLPRDAQHFYYLEDAGMGSTTTPYYLPRHNMVILPLTLLQPPLYHPQLHEVFQYSLIGFLLAHEITHGFDESGVDYDERGNMCEGFGELIKENEIFDGHLDCLLAKNPRIIDEKIADVSGLRWAYETYFGNATRAAQRLRWSKVSQQQLFFRNFALFFCGDISTEDLLVNSTHGTYRSRLHDAISQFGEFGRAYNCPPDASMNPTRKCQLWR